MKDLLKRLAGATRLMKSEAATETDEETVETPEEKEEANALDSAIAEIQKSITGKPDSEEGDDEEEDDPESHAAME